MKNNLVGIVGGEKKRGAIQIAKVLATQIAANNCYTDVKLGFVYSEEEKNQWEFAKWLPHVWSEDKKTRFVAMNKAQVSEIFYEFTRVCRSRAEDNKDFLNLTMWYLFLNLLCWKVNFFPSMFLIEIRPVDLQLFFWQKKQRIFRIVVILLLKTQVNFVECTIFLRIKKSGNCI